MLFSGFVVIVVLFVKISLYYVDLADLEFTL